MGKRYFLTGKTNAATAAAAKAMMIGDTALSKEIIPIGRSIMNAMSAAQKFGRRVLVSLMISSVCVGEQLRLHLSGDIWAAGKGTNGAER